MLSPSAFPSNVNFEDKNLATVDDMNGVVDTCGYIVTNISYTINQRTILGDNNGEIKLDLCNGILFKFQMIFVGSSTMLADKQGQTKADKVKLGRGIFP